MMPDQSFRTGTGLAETSHGALVPAREALRWGGADQRIQTVRVNSDDGSDAGAVSGHSDTRRLFSENQRLAILARDRGCTFPACDRPAAWSQMELPRVFADTVTVVVVARKGVLDGEGVSQEFKAQIVELHRRGSLFADMARSSRCLRLRWPLGSGGRPQAGQG